MLDVTERPQLYAVVHKCGSIPPCTSPTIAALISGAVIALKRALNTCCCPGGTDRKLLRVQSITCESMPDMSTGECQ